MPNCKLTKKISLTDPYTCILPSFSQNTSQWKCVSTFFFRKCRRKVVLLVFYLLDYDSPKSTFFIWHLKFSWVQFLSNKMEFFTSYNINVTRRSFYLLCVLICNFFKIWTLIFQQYCVFFPWFKALYKWWEMLFISS